MDSKTRNACSYDIDIVGPFLEMEWREVVRRLDKNVVARLKCPHFRINQSAKDWGRWYGGGTDILELKAELLEHPWTSVLEVLKHEIAHQVAEFLYGTAVKPHGPEFKRICQQLGANPLASGSSAPPDIDIFAEHSDEGTETGRLYARIRKLLALAASTDQNEAELALTKAHQLMAKHGIVQMDSKDGFDDFSIYTPHLPVSWQYCIGQMLALIVREHFHVDSIATYEPNLLTGRTHKVIALCGSKGDLRVAGYVWDCLVRFLQSSWKSARRKLWDAGCVVNSHAFKSFALGALDKINTKLKAQAASEPETYAIAPADDKRLHDYFHWLFPSAKIGRKWTTSVNADFLEMGREAGADFQLTPGLDGKEGQQTRFLT